ncbi:unnamed protein product [Prunus armeniaca]
MDWISLVILRGMGRSRLLRIYMVSNIGPHCVVDDGEDGSCFQRIFICFKASIDGF